MAQRSPEPGVVIYRDWIGHRLGRPTRRLVSYFRGPQRRDDLASRHDPATAVVDDPRDLALLDVVVVPAWLLLLGVVEAVSTAVAAGVVLLANTVRRRPWLVVVERDGSVVEQHQVVGWWRSRAMLRALGSQHQ